MDSPFSQYLDSGYSPSDAEIPLIKGLIQQRVEVIGRIDVEIKDVEDSLTALKAQRKANKIFIRKHQALISPIKRLPLDILSTVFLACLPVVKLTEASMTRNHPAVVISHVCRQWRQLAFDTPLLWSRIRLILPYVNPEPFYHPYQYPASDETDVNEKVAILFDSAIQRLYDAATIWLARSKGCPLSIFMEASEGSAGGFVIPQMKTLEGSILKGLEKLVDLLRGESQRWERVRFKFAIHGNRPESQLNRLLFLTPQDVPILRKASIVINSLDTIIPMNAMGSDITNSWDGFTMGTIHGQALGSLTLACPKAATRLKVLRVNWAGLTELSLRPYKWVSGRKAGTHFTADEALDLLRLCPNLKQCNLAIGDGSRAPGLGTPPAISNPLPASTLVAPVQDDRPVCRLPHLHSLTLREDSGQTDSLASALDLPSLRSFTQTSPGAWPRPPMGGFSPSHYGPGGYYGGLGTSHYDSEEGRTWYESPLAGWVQRFGHSITSIDFNHIGMPQQAVEQCLEELPNLISLTIRSPFLESWNTRERTRPGCDSFLKKLTPEVIEDGGTVAVSHGCLCPKLEDLVLNTFSNPVPIQLVFSEDSVLEFLTGRAKASLNTVPEGSRVSKLRYVSVGFVKPKVMDLEQELKRKGLNVEDFLGEWNYPAPSRPHSYLLNQIPTIGDSAMDGFL